MPAELGDCRRWILHIYTIIPFQWHFVFMFRLAFGCLSTWKLVEINFLPFSEQFSFFVDFSYFKRLIKVDKGAFWHWELTPWSWWHLKAGPLPDAVPKFAHFSFLCHFMFYFPLFGLKRTQKANLGTPKVLGQLLGVYQL